MNDKMNLLYIAPLPIDFDRPGGVPKKVLAHVRFFSGYFETHLVYYYNGTVYLYDVANDRKRAIGKGKSKLGLLRAARKLIKRCKYDSVYIRYPESDLFFLRFLKAAKKNESKIIVEIPTFPYDLEGNDSLKGRIIRILDKSCRVYLKRYVDRIVTFSDDDEIFGIKTIRTINGIEFDSLSADCSDVDYKNVISAIAVSAMFRVHGFDRFIEGLHNYYSNGGLRTVQLKLVGNGDEYRAYQELVDRYSLNSNVLFLGVLHGKELEDAYAGCAVGVNSLAIHRQGLVFESTLKTKEYAAKGLPIVSSSYVDAFSAEGNKKYSFRIPADETPVDIDALIEFVDSIYESNNVKEIRARIREDAKSICDINITMKPIIGYLVL